MNNNRKKTKKIIFISYAILILCSLYLGYNIILLNGIENTIRGILILIIGLVDAVFIFKGLKIKKTKMLILFLVLIVLVSAIEFLGAYFINRAYSSINSINKNQVTYGTSLVVMSNSKISKVSDLSNKKIGIINDKDSIEGYIISQEIISENKISEKNLVEYEDFSSLLYDLYDGKIDAIFISSKYVSMFGSIDTFENIKDETKVIVSKTKTMAKTEDTTNTSSSVDTKPFTMLLMGIDSTEDDISNATSFNGDSIILVTFNPSTLNATMLSIPRDTYVPIMCFKNHIQNKITHAAWYGESCMMDTIENFTGINIDYYVKINFKGVVNLVDAVGGIDVDVPFSFCEQNSNRAWGKNTIYVTKGLHTINGEQALALSRNRHPNSVCGSKWTNYYSDDFVRGQNQQLVIKALLDKIKGIRDVNKIYKLLDLIQKNMDTNLTTNQILSFYNIGKNILTHVQSDDDVVSFQKLYLKTYGAYIYDEGLKRQLSDQIYYKGSLDDIVKAMNINLGLEKPEMVKTFSFSVNTVYEEQIIGKGNYNETAIALVPDFTDHSKQYAINWGANNKVTINFKTVDSSSSSYTDGQITNQSIPATSLVSIAKSKGITLTIINKVETKTTTDKIDCTDEENKDNKTCIIPNFVDSSLSAVTTWQNKLTSTSVTVNKIATKTKDKDKDNIVFSQDESKIGKSLYDLSQRTITIEYYHYEEDTSESSDPTDPLLPSSGD